MNASGSEVFAFFATPRETLFATKTPKHEISLKGKTVTSVLSVVRKIKLKNLGFLALQFL
jgi:hypothetical protein